MIMEEILSSFNLGAGSYVNEILVGAFLAIATILAGVIIGKFFSYVLKKLFHKINLRKSVRQSFLDLIVIIIKWSIYIIFFTLALKFLPLRSVTGVIAKFLVVIPAVTGAAFIIFVGFTIAVFLRNIVRESGISQWNILANYLFYFILYISGVYAVKLALISIDGIFSGLIIVSLTLVIGTAVAYRIVKSTHP